MLQDRGRAPVWTLGSAGKGERGGGGGGRGGDGGGRRRGRKGEGVIELQYPVRSAG